MSLWLIIIILGLVEGLTEFLPISSTGHLIIASEAMNFEQVLGSKELADLFEVVIQLGAILAIGLLYREKLIRAFWSPVAYGLALMAGRAKKGGTVAEPRAGVGPDGEPWSDGEEPLLSGDRMLFFNIMLGTIPAAFVGFLVHDYIEEYLFSSLTVAVALIVGGIIIFIIEKRAPEPTATSTSTIRPWQALMVGVIQILSLVPGTSRSGATIMGGLCAKMSRPAATEFSFLLSFPIMCMATAYSLIKKLDLLTMEYMVFLLAGTFVAFVSAYVVVKWLIRFVQTHSFRIFGWWRIAVGLLVLWLHYAGFFANLEQPAPAPDGTPVPAEAAVAPGT